MLSFSRNNRETVHFLYGEEYWKSLMFWLNCRSRNFPSTIGVEWALCLLFACPVPTDLFVLGDTLGSWTEAKDWCQKQGYELASIRNDAENSIAAALGRAVDRQMWIGGELNWQWQDGSEWSYTNWHTGEPNAPHNEQCLHFYGGLGTWNDLTCDESQKHRPLCRSYEVFHGESASLLRGNFECF